MTPFDRRTMAAAYDVVADSYIEAFANDLGRLGLDRAVLDSFAKLVADGGPVVDLGCGPGQVGEYLRDRQVRTVGVDVSFVMLSTTRGPSRGVTQADIRQLPFRSGSCAGVVAFYSIHHLQRSELNSALGEITRVLREHGPVLIATHLGEGEVYTDELLGHQVPQLGGTLYRLDDLVEAMERSSFVLSDLQLRDPLPHEYSTQRAYITAHTGSIRNENAEEHGG